MKEITRAVRRRPLLKRVSFVVLALGVAAIPPVRWFLSVTSHEPVVLAPMLDSASSLRLLAVGRQGYGNAMSRRIADAMERAAAEAPTHAVLILGDNFYPNGVATVDDPQWRTKFERLYDGRHVRGMPFFAVLGNHDVAGNKQAQIDYARQRKGSARWQMDDLYYVRDFGHVNGRVLARIVFLDTIALQKDPAPELAFAKQACEAPGNPIWRVIAGHYALRSATREPYTRERTLTALLPQFKALQIDLYVSANDRFQQILDRDGEPVHLSTNGGSDKQETGLAPEDPEHDVVAAQPGFAVIRLDAGKMTVELRDSQGIVTHSRSRSRF